MPEAAHASARRGVLITRPEADAAETAARVAALGFEPLLAPAIRIISRALRVPAGRKPQAVLVTSRNALPALPAAWRSVPMLAVGDATAARARALGFWRVSSAGRDAAALLQLVALSCDPAGSALLLASGEGQGMPLLAALQTRGFRVVRRVAYQSRPVQDLPDPARAALAAGELEAALFFSPASAQAFAAALRRCGMGDALGRVICAAISPATAQVLLQLGWRDIRVAAWPDQDGLLACLR